MWLFNSSIGRKLVMSLSGLFLILFLTFHLAMNFVAVFSGEAYNMVCEFLGANWYALVGTLILALGFVTSSMHSGLRFRIVKPGGMTVMLWLPNLNR